MSKTVTIVGLSALAILAAFGAVTYLLPELERRNAFQALSERYTTNASELKPLTDADDVRAAKIDDKWVASAKGLRTIIARTAVAVDTSKTYRVRARLRVLSNDETGQGPVTYVGVATYGADGALQTSGVGSHRYAAVYAKRFDIGDWIEVEGLITGEGDTKHTEFRPGTLTVRPLVVLNYKSKVSETALDWIVVEEVESAP